MKKAIYWHGLVEVLIKQANIEDKNINAKKDNFETISIADELKKLVELKESGVLTNDEFQQQKSKLLGE